MVGVLDWVFGLVLAGVGVESGRDFCGWKGMVDLKIVWQ